MRINDDHMYHGAALTQIAEQPIFKSINAFWNKGKRSSCGFRINDTTGVYIKYAASSRGHTREYLFTFSEAHLQEFRTLREQCQSVFAVLVCIGDKCICVVSYGQIMELIKLRTDAKGHQEDQYQIIVEVPPNKQFRVYTNMPNRKGIRLGEILVARNAFPQILFHG